MSFMRRKRQFGSLPVKQPNRHRLHKAATVVPFVLPAEANDPAVPFSARRELKTRLHRLHQEMCNELLSNWKERQRGTE